MTLQPAHTTGKKAVLLQHGDVCVGPAIGVDHGTVQSTTACDGDRIQINWIGGSYSIVPEDYQLWVEPLNVTRRAVVRTSQADQVRAYLPANYRVVGSVETFDGIAHVTVEGCDLHGWTLTEYVLPRLASGLHSGVEVTAEQVAS